MHRFGVCAGALIGLAAIAMGSGASAAILTATYTGTVASGFDTTGVFGAANTDLTGDAYTATYVIDTSKGARTTIPPFYDLVSGGTTQGAGLANPVDARIEINGVTVDIGGDYYGYSLAYPGAGGLLQQFDENSSTQGSHYINNYSGSYAYGTDVTTVDAPVSLMNSLNNGYAEIFDVTFGVGYNAYAYADLTGAGTIQMTLSAVPEPVTWSLMLVGVGMIGATLRGGSRRRATHTAN